MAARGKIAAPALPPLPSVLAALAKAAGREAALKLSLERGGTRFNIPAKAEGSELASIVGLEAAAKICAKFAGERPYVPLAKTHLIHWLADSGLSEERIAQKLKTSRRTVQKTLAGERDTLQFDLFVRA